MSASQLRKPIMEVLYEGRVAHLLFTRRPTQPEMGWVQFQDDKSKSEVSLQKVQIVALHEGQKEE
jgi:ParB family chromosome partitioning protein